MMCPNCNYNVPNDTAFCVNCGYRVANQPPSGNLPQQGMEVNTNIQSYQSNAYQNANLPNFHAYVDQHIRNTTKYQSTSDLLSKPHIFLYDKFFFAVSLLFFLMLLIFFVFRVGSTAFFRILFIVGIAWLVMLFLRVHVIIPMKLAPEITKKYSLTTDCNIDENNLLYFLNTYLAPNKPYFHDWSIYTGPDILTSIVVGGLLFGGKGATYSGIKSALKNSSDKKHQRIQFKSKFGKSLKKDTLLSIQLSGNEYSPNEQIIYVDTEDCYTLYKIAPVIQATMQYYLRYFANNASS